MEVISAIEAIDMNNNIIQNVADPLTNQDVASNNYIDINAFTTAGGVVSGEIKLNVGFDLIRCLWCNNISTGKIFILLLGTNTNMLAYTFHDSGLPMPFKIKSDRDFAILINQLPICDFSQDVI